MGDVIELERSYDIEAGHHLTAGVPEGHPCRRVHGHGYRLTIWLEGELDEDGMLIEYAALDRVVLPIVRMLDHHNVNSLAERCSTPQAAAVTANPTVERMVAWLRRRLEGIVASAVPGARLRLVQIRLQEDPRTAAGWRADG